MTTAVYDEPAALHMGLPLPNGKVAMWLFLVTEIMFFTGLIGTYILLRNGTPTPNWEPWPAPHDVHLAEWMGAVFLVIKAVEYNAKFSHSILPGRVFEKLDGPSGPAYLRHVREQLEHIVK